MDTPRQLSAEILGHAAQTFSLEVTQDEFGIFGADCVIGVCDVATAKHLDLKRIARAAGLHEFVDQLFHGEVAKTRRLKIAGPFAGVAMWEHEMIHAADAGPLIADAS